MKRRNVDLVDRSQTPYARALRRDQNMLDGHVPERICGRAYAAKRASLTNLAVILAYCIGIVATVVLATRIAIH